MKQERIQQIHSRLVEAAKTEEKFVYYKEIIQMADIGHLGGGGISGELGHIFYEVNEYDRQFDPERPMLTAVAVSSDMQPGSGFYRLASDYGKFQKGQDELKFWIKELEALREYWQSQPEQDDTILPDTNANVSQTTETTTYTEGSKTEYMTTKYERNPQARQACIDYHGVACGTCEFSFGEMYGAVGEDYIEVHHLIPVSEQEDEYEVDPINDLIPVCSNCHAMMHRKSPPYTPDELRDIINNR